MLLLETTNCNSMNQLKLESIFSTIACTCHALLPWNQSSTHHFPPAACLSQTCLAELTTPLSLSIANSFSRHHYLKLSLSSQHLPEMLAIQPPVKRKVHSPYLTSAACDICHDGISSRVGENEPGDQLWSAVFPSSISNKSLALSLKVAKTSSHSSQLICAVKP